MKKLLQIICILLLMQWQQSVSLHAEYQASSSNYRLENWNINNGSAERPVGSVSYSIYLSTIGQPVIGVAVSNPKIINEIPTFENKIIIGFLFTNWFEYFNVDNQYDIQEIHAYKFNNGPEIQEVTWTNDTDPYFTWERKIPDLPIAGYSVAFDELPDKFVDTLEPSYQTPDFYLTEGVHQFYVVAKTAAGGFGNVKVFELWVDAHEPTISDILPMEGAVLNTGKPTVQATVKDALSRIDPASIDIRVTAGGDVFQALGTYDEKTGIVSYTPAEPFPDGVVTIQMAVFDQAGNSAMPLIWTFTIDTTSPTGSVRINNGATATGINSVTLNISAEELETEIDSMMVSNDGIFDTEVWEPYTETREQWLLTPLAGIKTVYVKFRDAAGNESPVYSDSIVLTISGANTFITRGPSTFTQQTEAAFVFTATRENCVFYYKLDNESWIGPITESTANFSDLTMGNHYFQVKAAWDANSNGTVELEEADPTPAIASWTIGTLSPSTLYAERPVKYYRRE